MPGKIERIATGTGNAGILPTTARRFGLIDRIDRTVSPIASGRIMPNPIVQGRIAPGSIVPGRIVPGRIASGSNMPGVNTPGRIIIRPAQTCIASTFDRSTRYQNGTRVGHPTGPSGCNRTRCRSGAVHRTGHRHLRLQTLACILHHRLGFRLMHRTYAAHRPSGLPADLKRLSRSLANQPLSKLCPGIFAHGSCLRIGTAARCAASGAG
jgi:hypothetical protein